MLKELKFVQGAIAAKDYIPNLQHFKIGGGRIEGYNGALALSIPTDLQIEAMPKAVPFVKAIERLPDSSEVVLNLTKAGRLSVKSGNFRVHVECWPPSEAFHHVTPSGEIHAMHGEILPILKRLSPFMGVDASRAWAMGILFKGQSAFATNNIVLIEHWLPIVFPDALGIPAEAIKEMLRINTEPESIQIGSGNVTFHYPGGAWLWTSLLATEWPDLAAILDRPNHAVPLPSGFFEAVARLDAFTDKTNRLYLRGNTLATSTEEGDGALVGLEEFGGVGCHFLSQMVKLDGVAATIDLSMWPAPCLFYGEMLRGAIVGLRTSDAV